MKTQVLIEQVIEPLWIEHRAILQDCNSTYDLTLWRKQFIAALTEIKLETASSDIEEETKET